MQRAIEIAKEIFFENELTAEYLDARNFDFVEDKSIKRCAEELTKEIFYRYGATMTKEEVYSYSNEILKNNENFNYIYEEILNILEDDYNILLDKITI